MLANEACGNLKFQNKNILIAVAIWFPEKKKSGKERKHEVWTEMVVVFY